MDDFGVFVSGWLKKKWKRNKKIKNENEKQKCGEQFLTFKKR